MKAYLAGPDVFLPDAVKVLQSMQEKCKAAGFQGVIPIDNTFPEDYHDNVAVAMYIRNRNIDKIRDCQLVFANVSPFRGPHADDGTAFEVGYAIAMAKPVYCYSTDSNRTLLERIRGMRLCDKDSTIDHDNWVVENFGLPVNLMLCHAVIHSSFDEALAEAKKWMLRT
jgi:nucleoside 2-deoxyribosyltransferase